MPAFRFLCSKCGNEFMKLLDASTSVFPCKCGTDADIQLASSQSTLVFDTRDRFRGKQVRRNVERKLKDRLRDHHDRYEVEGKIDEHGLNDAVKFGWTKKIKRI